MIFASISYVIILLILRLPLIVLSTTESTCNSPRCLTVIDYLTSASINNSDPCLNPFERFCNLTINKKPTLLQMKAKQVTARREGIFEGPINWSNHSSLFIRNLLQEWSVCIESAGFERARERLVGRVTNHIDESKALVIQRAIEQKVVYFEPLMLPVNERQRSTHSKVKAMSPKELCYHEIERNYVYGIDRMYIEAYGPSQKQIKRGWKKIKSFLSHARLRSSNLLDLLSINCSECLGDPNTMQFKYGYPDFLLDDAQLKLMYENVEFMTEEERLMRPSAKPVWALPIYPDSAWYSIEENVLCKFLVVSRVHPLIDISSSHSTDITPTFFDRDLLHSSLPDAWNFGGFFTILRAFLGALVQPGLMDGRLASSPHLSSFSHLCLNESAGRSFNQHVHATCLLDYFALELVQNFSAQLDKRGMLSMNATELFDFRMFNDLCGKIPEDDLMYRAFVDANGRIHNYDLILNYKWHERERFKCNQTSLNSTDAPDDGVGDRPFP